MFATLAAIVIVILAAQVLTWSDQVITLDQYDDGRRIVAAGRWGFFGAIIAYAALIDVFRVGYELTTLYEVLIAGTAGSALVAGLRRTTE